MPLPPMTSRETTIDVEENGDIVIYDGAPPAFRQLDYDHDLRDVPANFAYESGRTERGVIVWSLWTHSTLRDRSDPEAWMVQILLFAFYKE